MNCCGFVREEWRSCSEVTLNELWRYDILGNKWEFKLPEMDLAAKQSSFVYCTNRLQWKAYGLVLRLAAELWSFLSQVLEDRFSYKSNHFGACWLASCKATSWTCFIVQLVITFAWREHPSQRLKVRSSLAFLCQFCGKFHAT